MIFAQEQNSSLNLTLEQAQDYAVSNNKAVKSAKLDVMASRAAVWETISAALPSVEGSGSFTDNLKLMTTLLPGEFFGQRVKRFLLLLVQNIIQVFRFRHQCFCLMHHYI